MEELETRGAGQIERPPRHGDSDQAVSTRDVDDFTNDQEATDTPTYAPHLIANVHSRECPPREKEVRGRYYGAGSTSRDMNEENANWMGFEPTTFLSGPKRLLSPLSYQWHDELTTTPGPCQGTNKKGGRARVNELILRNN